MQAGPRLEENIMWQELAKVLAQLIKEYQKLQALNEEKRGVLVLVKLKDLERIVQQEEQVIKEINSVEESRKELLNRIVNSGVKLSQASHMQDVWGQCPDMSQRDLLRRLHTALAKLVAEVQEASANNEILIRGALDAINFKRNQLGGTSVEPAYGQGGQELVSHEKNFDFEA